MEICVNKVHFSRNMATKETIEMLSTFMDFHSKLGKTEKDALAYKLGNVLIDVMQLNFLIEENNRKTTDELSRKILQLLFQFDVPASAPLPILNILWQMATSDGQISRTMYLEELINLKTNLPRNTIVERFPLRTCYLHHAVNFKTCKSLGMRVTTEQSGCVTPWYTDTNSNIITVHEVSSYSFDAAFSIMKKYLEKLAH